MVVEKLSNKQIRDIFIQTQLKKLYIHNFWTQKFRNNVNCENIYYFLNYGIKQYRYKLFHRIIAINENLFTWKSSSSRSLTELGNYPTVGVVTSVIKWKLLTIFDRVLMFRFFGTRISYVFKSCGVSKQERSLQYLVIGYKSELLEYNWTTFYLGILVLLFINLIFVVKEGKNSSTYSIF